MLKIIFPYRNREISRVKTSLDSLDKQWENNFYCYFVDYGSENEFSAAVKRLCEEYPFIEYVYHSTQNQPWNKARALNSVIRHLEKGYCFVADVDMIFHPEFVSTAIDLQRGQKSVFFKVGFSEAPDKPEQISPEDFANFRQSDEEATGLSMFPVNALHHLHGFDEFYHFWGAEDTDMHVRLRNAGFEVEFYQERTLLLHQWHPSYRIKETTTLDNELQISGIVQLNHQHLTSARKNNIIQVNHTSWGSSITEKEYIELEQAPVNFDFDNEKKKLNDFLYGQLPTIRNKIIKAEFKPKKPQNILRHRMKKILGRKVPEYYSMREINDLILLHLISFYRDLPYSYKVNPALQEIEVAIKF